MAPNINSQAIFVIIHKVQSSLEATEKYASIVENGAYSHFLVDLNTWTKARLLLGNFLQNSYSSNFTDNNGYYGLSSYL